MGNSIGHSDEFAPRVINPEGTHPILLICEHASRKIPPAFGDLGLSAAELESHIAWDPGALTTALALSDELNATLVHASVSRLIYDCNRPPESDGAMPQKSEATVIPGNGDLTEADRCARVDAFYRPFESLVMQTIEAKPRPPVIVTIHSFTPVYFGVSRTVEIGILHDTDSRLADVMLNDPGKYRVGRNDPYGPEDGVTHTLRRHALPNDLLNVMIEIRNDLIDTPERCAEMADVLAGWLNTSLKRLGHDRRTEALA